MVLPYVWPLSRPAAGEADVSGNKKEPVHWRWFLVYPLQKRRAMQKYTASVTWLVCLLVGVASTWSHASDGITLSPADEQAYLSAQAAWERLAKVHEDAGIPQPGDPPKRENFIDYSAQRVEAAEQDITDSIKAEAHWQQRVNVARPYLRTLVRPDNAEAQDHRTKLARQEKARLLEIADERFIRQPQIEAELNAIAARHGVSRVLEVGEETSITLSGEIDGHLLWIGSLNQIAGASISADELWPTNTVPWPSSSTGLDLTGSNVVLGMWEPANSAVRESHGEFQGRVIQVDQKPTNPIPLHYHPTGVAGTMAAGGVFSFISPGSGTLARGVAYQANVESYDLALFSTEIADATAGTTNMPGIRLSNHSYGRVAGWRFDIPAPGLWSWWGFFDVLEDFTFGWYTPDLQDGTGSTQLDTFLSEEATRHLLIYAAGNGRLVGPGSPTNYYFLVGTNWFLIQNPSSGSRLWFNGDGGTYGFDTVLPPGTAKNVLTVGSVRDVYHVIGGQTNWGYSTSSVVSVSLWSAAGPTDDGRIKPDVVAVGEADQNVRGFPALVTPHHAANDAFQYQDGTSYAAPAITAGIGLGLQRRSQFFPNLEPDIDDWRGSTLKALAIHTADTVGDLGPSYTTGWGLFNAVSLVRQIERDAFDGRGTHIKELFLDVDESISWRVYSDGTAPLKVTIAWSDPAGGPPLSLIVDHPTPMLVNNLDLVIQNESQTQTWMPWILNPDLTNKTEAARSAAARTGYDDRNNVEQVYIAEPEEGLYLITVAHAGGHSGGPVPIGQWVSVITSGDIPLSPQSTALNLAPAGDEILLTFDCDPGAYLFLETTTDMNDPQSWGLIGQLVTESVTNAVLVETDGEIRFWRLRRETP